MENSKVLIDTSVLIDVQKGNIKNMKIFYEQIDRFVVSRISAIEFIYGSENKRDRNKNSRFIKKCQVVELDTEISKYSYILLEKYGLKLRIGIADLFIASTSIVKSLPVWSVDKHFLHIKEIKNFKAS